MSGRRGAGNRRFPCLDGKGRGKGGSLGGLVEGYYVFRDSYMTYRSDKNKMAALLKRIGTLRTNTGTSLVIHHLRRLSPCGKLCLSDCSSYSTETAASKTEEFSLRYLEGKHEGLNLKISEF